MLHPFMIHDCCTLAFANGHLTCPTCRCHSDSTHAEREKARTAANNIPGLSDRVKFAVRAGLVSSAELGFTGGIRRAILARNPARRLVYKIFGIYLPEGEAREVLRKIHDFKWIEAEKAGFDIWSRSKDEPGFVVAANKWAKSHLRPYLSHRGLEAA